MKVISVLYDFLLMDYVNHYNNTFIAGHVCFSYMTKL